MQFREENHLGYIVIIIVCTLFLVSSMKIKPDCQPHTRTDVHEGVNHPR